MTQEPRTAAPDNATSPPAPTGRIHRPASALPAQPAAAVPGARAGSSTDSGQPAQPSPVDPGADRPRPGAERDANQPPGGGPSGGANQPGGREPGGAEPAAEGSPFAPGAGLLAVFALLWLAAMLWSAQAAISSSGLAEMAITSAAYALPGAISAGLVGGAALGLTVVNTVGRRPVRGARLAGNPTRRFTLATLAGLLTGVVGALVVLASYGGGDTVSVLAGTIAAAGTIGGAVAGIRAARVVAAVVAAGLTVFAIGFAVNLFQPPLLAMFGAGDTQASQAGAVGWFGFTASVTSGLGAGLVAYGYLRRTARRAGDDPPRWTAYAAAGAGAGLLLLIAELLAHTAGARVLAMAGAVSEADRVAQSLLSGARVNNALIVLFVGAVVAIIAVGRTIRPTTDDAPTDPAVTAHPTEPGWS